MYWDFNPGQMIDVPVMTNAASCELLLNGVSLGRKDVSFSESDACLPRWRIPFEPGRLTARAYDLCGACIAEVSRETPGNSRRLVLRAEDNVLLGDGFDMTFIRTRARRCLPRFPIRSRPGGTSISPKPTVCRAA